ncbi:transglutaminase TgpA family protein [Crateriforma conspicua]|uniref:transglutaminase TgpA family protein n=1 Tax=Crateriforma conspicua TaxID=2527996 RepID=UPI001187B35E|nr:transglutaminaseTgpA domain-containing protein [Crateriforma conspicua]QDV63746.1 Protein-glutamine gamma-glutamyltransferase [Crateriforma conspicua]
MASGQTVGEASGSVVVANPTKPQRRLINRTQLSFAVLSCLGGLAMRGDNLEGLATTAAVFSIFGYLFVDRFRLFSMPAPLAYTAMGIAGLYCVSDFSDLGGPGSKQIEAVAYLLVSVQAVLMLQRKTQRIYEQIVVFCLLQLIVAAVFNDALQFGAALIPIGLVGVFGVSLLSTASAATEGDDSLAIDQTFHSALDAQGRITVPPSDEMFQDDEPEIDLDEAWILTGTPESNQSLALAGRRTFWVIGMTITPAVMLIAAIFFYALPRMTDASTMGSAGSALVGFNDEVDLMQVGKLLQSGETALRVRLQDRRTGKLYQITGPMYLRGRALETYSVDLSNELSHGMWRSRNAGVLSRFAPTPVEYDGIPAKDRALFDSVTVTVNHEATKSQSLFGIVPYFEVAGPGRIHHTPASYELSRPKRSSGGYPRYRIRYTTNAFYLGDQSEFISPWTTDDPWGRTHRDETRFADDEELLDIDSEDDARLEQRLEIRNLRYKTEEDWEKYLELCTEWSRENIPTAGRLAKMIRRDMSADRGSTFDFVKAAENLFSARNDFEYTLDLSADILEGVDPIEQFLKVDRRGHCQFFASGLIMMLRSEGIPARMVVGYCTDEYNTLGDYYVARQLHAHAWVEALLHKDELPPTANLAGQRPSEYYWVRLDPTPGGSGGGIMPDRSGGVNQVLDIAQNLWDDYVVDMDGGRQDRVLSATAGSTPMSDAYTQMIQRLQASLARARAGELGGGSLAKGNRFSLPAALATISMSVMVIVLLRLKLPALLGRNRGDLADTTAARPTLAFYADAVDQLQRLGVHRRTGQTPAELSTEISAKTSPSRFPAGEPFAALTRLFYAMRYRGDRVDAKVTDSLLDDLNERVGRIVNQGDIGAGASGQAGQPDAVETAGKP